MMPRDIAEALRSAETHIRRCRDRVAHLEALVVIEHGRLAGWEAEAADLRRDLAAAERPTRPDPTLAVVEPRP